MIHSAIRFDASVNSAVRPDDWLAQRVGGRMIPGSVLVHAPSAAFQAPGGGEVQLVETSRALEALGIAVRPFLPWTDRLQDARLLHLFGMSREGLALARAARSARVPVALSPICWFEPASISALSNSRISAARAWAAWLARNCAPGLPHWRRELLRLADVILPNSQREADQLARLFAISPQKFRVIPNGVDGRFARADGSLFERQFGVSDFVLYVGRIEPRKNLIALVRATRALRLKLVVIGDAVPGFEDYASECRKAGDPGLIWIPRLDHHDPLLASAYAAARVCALPSWFETPGLAALEASLAGCEVVITPLGSTREYFAELANYAHPKRPLELTTALRRALRGPRQPDLARWVENRYLWSHVARKTAEVYGDLKT